MTQEQDRQDRTFFTPEQFAAEQAQCMESPRGKLMIAGCCSGSHLSSKVAQRYNHLLAQAGSEAEVQPLDHVDRRFSDSETCVRLDQHVGGNDVFLFQALFDPTADTSIDQNYMAFLIAARTFREHGANYVTGVLPYLAYARQDKPTKFKREPTTAKLMADLSVAAGIDRVMVWDPHCDQIRGYYGTMPVTMLQTLTLFIDKFERFRGRDDVIVVAPDAGASKFVTHFGRALGLKCAIASKYRPRPEEVVISEVIGDFAGKQIAIVLDDMISSGGSMHALIQKLAEEMGIEEVYLGVSHNLCVGRAGERLCDLHSNYGLREVVVTNSIPQTDQFESLPFVTICCLSDALARTINRIHCHQSVSEVFYRE